MKRTKKIQGQTIDKTMVKPAGLVKNYEKIIIWNDALTDSTNEQEKKKNILQISLHSSITTALCIVRLCDYFRMKHKEKYQEWVL